MKIFSFIFLFSINSVYASIDKIIVFKEERTLQLIEKGNVVKEYSVRLSIANNNPMFKPGPKRLRGDNKTPVGLYKIIKKRENTNYRKSLRINYPNKDDILWGRLHGHSIHDLGDNILIHGERIKPAKYVIDFAKKLGISEESVDRWAKEYYYPFFDWTNGCIAVNEFEIEEIFQLVKVGTPIEIHASRKRGMDRDQFYHSPSK